MTISCHSETIIKNHVIQKRYLTTCRGSQCCVDLDLFFQKLFSAPRDPHPRYDVPCKPTSVKIMNEWDFKESGLYMWAKNCLCYNKLPWNAMCLKCFDESVGLVIVIAVMTKIALCKGSLGNAQCSANELSHILNIFKVLIHLTSLQI